MTINYRGRGYELGSTNVLNFLILIMVWPFFIRDICFLNDKNWKAKGSEIGNVFQTPLLVHYIKSVMTRCQDSLSKG